ncbi:MAG: DsrE family protein [Aquincola sp.]|nr:DsrE family protein [Aquincola sp.]MDH5331011.1 DsrE family protein [Aquincola sp.]
MKNWLAALAVAFVAMVSSAPWAQTTASTPAASAPKYRVIFQVSNPDPRGWNQALNNSLALTKNAGRGNVQIRIVANGMGIGMLKENSPSAKLVAAAIANGVTVLACGETMKALLLEKDDMLPDIGYVPGGIIEILDRQSEGWRYIKAD